MSDGTKLESDLAEALVALENFVVDNDDLLVLEVTVHTPGRSAGAF
jgi:hypothetical protein